MNYLPLIWIGLWRKPVRTALTFASLVVAFVLFGLLSGINQGLDTVTQRFQLDRLYVMNRISMYHPLILPMMLPQLEKVPGVTDVAYWGYFVGYYQQPTTQLPVVAADVDRMFRMYPELRIPKTQLEEMSRVKSGAVISRSLANRFKWDIGDRVPLKSSLWPRKDGGDSWLFDIVGIYEPAEASPALNDLFFINLSYFDDARAFGAGAIQLFILRIDDERKAGEISNAVDAMFENSPFQTRTRSENAYAAVQWRQLQDLRVISNAIVGAVVFTLVVVVWSTMSQAIRQRFSEFATLMALGFTPGRVAFVVICEGLLLTVLAAVIGLAIAAASFPFVAQLFGAMKMQPAVIAMGIALAVAIGLVSSVIPAFRVGRLNIVDALSGR